MGLFDRNPNEAAFAGGKKHWADVIKNSEPGQLLLWRQPEEDFNTNSTLIVMPGEQAIFIRGGSVEAVFDSGTYQLSTENYPFIGRLRRAFTGGVSTFSCVVYFVRQAHSQEVLWGTSSPIQLRDPVIGIMTSLRGRGSFKVKIDNGAKFLEKMIGNNVPLTFQEELLDYFSNQMQQAIKSSIAQHVQASGQEILGIAARLDALAQALTPRLQGILDDYGIGLVDFSISALDIPESDPSRQKLEDAFASKGVMSILGDDWGRQQATEILHNLANNPGSGGVASAGAGVGLGVAAAGAFGNLAGQMFQPMRPPAPPAPQAAQPGRFAQADAQPAGPTPGGAPDLTGELVRLGELRTQGLLTDEEFAAAKRKLLGL
jgi:membrane protease subunit (stomatin/prohibitin family)